MSDKRNKETYFKDFYTWYFKDWFISGARTRLSLPARAIYLDLLGLAYTEGGIVNDPAVLMQRLGIATQYKDATVAALTEFEIDSEDETRLTHPRVLKEATKLERARAARSKAGTASGKARASQITAKPAEAAVLKECRHCGDLCEEDVLEEHEDGCPLR